MKQYGDITKLSGAELPAVDVVIGGSPCQDLSVAGQRAGLAGSRSSLFLEQIRIVKEMRQKDERTRRTNDNLRPRYMLWENVPGAFSSNKGADFQRVLSEIVRIAEPDAPDVPMPAKKRWPKAGVLYDELGGWSIAWRVHDAQFWGVPQRRKRIALVADFRGLSAAELLFERKGLRGDPEKSREARKEASGDTEEGIKTAVYDARGNGDGKIVPTITGDHNDRITDYTAICIGNGQTNQSISDKYVQPLNCMHDQQIVIYGAAGHSSYTQGVGTIRAASGGRGTERDNVVIAPNIVRRLTPLECERLQGFPDGWTDIGEWIDSKGKKRQTTDTARYKALGNSIALPFWQYLARRIVAQYEHEVSVGSLFDGIGGFPLVFERCGAKAVWASEIEEFPIAVTKKHFPESEQTEKGDA